MAISTSQSILSMLKVWYKDGVQNLMFRNSPLLQKIEKTRVEGKQQNFSAIYGRGGAVAARFTLAQQNAKQQTRNVEFEVKPGQVFSVYTMNGKEVQASLTKRGAYMKVAGNKMFAASEGFRKTMAAAIYGRGYGELCFIDAVQNPSLTTIATAGTAVWMPTDAIMKIDIGTILDVKASIATGTIIGSAEVTAIDGNDVTLAAQTSAITVTPGTDVLCLAGSVDASGNPLLPMGLDGWIPPVNNRTGATWTTFIGNSFFGVTRSSASDRLAGAFVLGAASEKYSVTVQNLLMKCRRQGSQADIIVMNDEDFLTLSKEIETTNTYFTQTSTKAKKNATVGFDGFAASFSTNYIENIIDDPYCPKGKFYILDSSAIEMFSYTNTEKLSDGINGNNPGKQNPLDMENEGKENSPYGLIIDDYINVQPGSGSDDGPDVEVTLQFFGSLAVTNPSVCGVGIFDNNTTYIGYGL